MSQTEQFMRKLEGLEEGERSRLRRLAGQPLDETVPGFDLFTGLWWPLRRSPRAPERRTAWLVAKLYGAFPLPHVGGEQAELALLLGRRERAMRKEADGKRFRDRFDALLQAPLCGLEAHLRWALSAMRGAVAQKQAEGVDWVRLLDDLRLWARGPDRQDQDRKRRQCDIRDIWAQDYLNAVQRPERRS